MSCGITPEQEERIRNFVKGRLRGADIAHGFDHVEYVVNMTRKIAMRERADLRIVIPAAYMHDLVSRGEVESYDLHTGESVAEGSRFLKDMGFPANDIQKIGEVIMTSSYESYLKGKIPTSLEGKVLRDADWLDAIGARGIARVFVFAGHYGCPKMGTVDWDPEKPEKLEMIVSGPDPSPIYHFFSKLLWQKDLMLTNTGKMEAEKRHQFMVEFLKRYREEIQP